MVNEKNQNKYSKINKKSQNEDTTVWQFPYHVLAFCANAIRNYTKDPEEKLKDFKLTPWIEFKQLIFKVYDHRIENAAEVNGFILNSYVTLNEYLVVFFMDVFRDRG